MPAAPRLGFQRAVRAAVVTGACMIFAASLGAVFAPYVYGELLPFLSHEQILTNDTPALAKGRMLDDYFAVEDLGHGTYAIGEPRYWQQNYAYLIVGETQALLFDAGSGTRDLSAVIKQLTPLPLIVTVSHLHFDHLGGIAPFEHLALIDLPQTRARLHGEIFTPSRYEYVGYIEGRAARPSVKVTRWIKPGSEIDLGGRKLTVLSTPGHTPSSMALLDAQNHRLFIGDFIYPTTLYAFLPGASLSAYKVTTQTLLNTLPPSTVIYTAHCCRKGEGIAAPWLAMSDLEDLNQALAQLADGTLKSSGFFPRLYPVNEQMRLAAAFPWNNR